MPCESAIGIDENLTPGEAGVADGTAGYETAGRVDPILSVVVEQAFRDYCLCRMLNEVTGYDFLLHILAVLGAHNDCVDALGDAILVLDCNLRFAVRTEVWKGLVPAEFRHALAELVRQ